MNREHDPTTAGLELWPADTLDSTNCFLKPVEEGDIGLLRMVELLELGPRWRHHGATPSPDEFEALLWRGVLSQYVIMDKRTMQPIGWVSSYGADLINGFVYLSVARIGGATSKPTLAFSEGIQLFISSLFGGWPFRRVYATIAGYNPSGPFDSVKGVATLQATLPDHLFHDGKYWPEYIYAIERSRWDSFVQNADVARHASTLSAVADVVELEHLLESLEAVTDPSRLIADVVDSIALVELLDFLDESLEMDSEDLSEMSRTWTAIDVREMLVRSLGKVPDQ